MYRSRSPLTSSPASPATTSTIPARKRDPAQVRASEQDLKPVEKRVVFRSAWLPYALLAPQIAVTLVFFFWPAAQAIWFSFQLQDAFGLKTEFVGLRNFEALFGDGRYLASFSTTAIFSVLVAFFGIAIS